MYRRPLIATVAAVALAVTACSTTPAANNSGSSGGTAGAPAKVSLQLQWVAQGQFAGYYAAVDQGYYKDAGLDVTIKEGGVDIVPQTVLAVCTTTDDVALGDMFDGNGAHLFTTRVRLNDVRKCPFSRTEVPHTGNETEDGDACGQHEPWCVQRRRVAENSPAKTIDNANYRVHRVEKAPGMWNQAATESDR